MRVGVRNVDVEIIRFVSGPRNVNQSNLTRDPMTRTAQTRVVQGQDIQFMGRGEYDMEVVDRQKFSFSRRQPALTRLRLTLGAIHKAAEAP